MSQAGQQKQQQPAIPAHLLPTDLGVISFAESGASLRSQSTSQTESSAAIAELSQRLQQKSELIKAMETLLDVQSITSQQKPAVDSSLTVIADAVAVKAQTLPAALASFPSDLSLSAASGRLTQEVLGLVKNLFSTQPIDPALSQALQSICPHLAGDPADRTPQKLAEKVALQVASYAAGKPLPIQLLSQDIAVGGGSLTVSFSEQSGSPVVAIANHNTGVRSVFSSASLTPQDKEIFDELVTRLGRETLDPQLAGQALHFRSRPVPSLIGSVSPTEMHNVYELLYNVTKGAVTFEDIGQVRQDPLLRPLQVLMAAEPELKITTSYLDTAAHAVARLTAEKNAASPGEFDPAQHALQLGNAGASESVTFSRSQPGAARAVNQITLRRELGDFLVDVHVRGANGVPGLVSIKLDRNDASPDINLALDRLQTITEAFAQENKAHLSESQVFKALLLLGQIREVRSLDPKRQTEFSKANWLGRSLAADAEISDVIFTSSSLDLTGKGIRCSKCDFESCSIGFHAKDVEFKKVSFDPKCVMYGSLSGKFHQSRLQGNAFYLDIRGLEFKDFERRQNTEDREKIVKQMLSGVILNRHLVPGEISVYTRPYRGTSVIPELERVSGMFNGDVMLAQIVMNHPEFITMKGAGFWKTGTPTLDSSQLNSSSALSSFNTERFLKGHEGVINFYPPSFDPKKSGHTAMVRVFIDEEDGELKLRYMFGSSKYMKPDYREAQKAAKDNPGQIRLGEGNVSTFKAILSFQHLDFSQFTISAQGDLDAVKIPGSASS